MMETDTLAADFRHAMRRLTSAVAIITSCRDGTPSGMTATAVTSVSVDPPSLMIAVNRSASIHDVIVGSRRFCVNLLSRPHAELVEPFSGRSKGAERFAFGAWEEGPLGIPFLTDALASLLCEVDGALSYGSHTLFIGKVETARVARTAEPLVWQDGCGAAAYPLPPAQPKAAPERR
jgi:flavin reductase